MMQFLSKSIVRRLNFGIIALLSVALLVFTLFLAFLNFNRAHSQLMAKATNYLKLSQTALVDPIWNLNQPGLDALKDALLLDQDIVLVRILDEQGNILSQGAKPPYSGMQPSHFASRPELELFSSPVTKEGGKIGEVHFYTSQAQATSSGWETSFFLLLLTLILIALLSLLVGYMGWRFVKKPVTLLQESASQISRGNLDFPIEVQRHDELGQLARHFSLMRDSIKTSLGELKHLNENLESEVSRRTLELRKALVEVEEANAHILESLQYARMIQYSLLPNHETIKSFLHESFFIWMPRDIVGGDIFYSESFEDGFLVLVADCTGHGVPGALMTMITSAAMRAILHSEGLRDPKSILRRLNQAVKTSLQQDTVHGQSDDGLDAGLCWVQPKSRKLTFAGAKIPLLLHHNNQVEVIKGDRVSLGYRASNMDFEFCNQEVELKPGMSCYMFTDGFIDEQGGPKRFSFGLRRTKELLAQHGHLPLPEQREALLRALWNYKGAHDRQDDITFVGFSLDKRIPGGA